MSKALTLTSGTLSAKIVPFGATLAGLFAKDVSYSLTLGFADPADFQRIPLVAGAIVGPLANRLAGGVARIDGIVFQMPRNEHGRNTLHSGPEGLHRRTWHTVDASQDQVTLRCNLKHGECGLPGNREIEATYKLAGNRLSLHLTAQTDRPTLMNLAHHPYWAVDHRARLKVTSNRYLPVDADKLPLGRPSLVEDTQFDLRSARPIPTELDHNYVLGDAELESPKPVAVLQTPDYRMKLETTAPGLQVYSGAHLPKISNEKTTGWPIGPLSGVALEPQLWPDAPSHPNFPKVMLRPHTRWSQLTHYVIET